MNAPDLRYPIGPYKKRLPITAERIEAQIGDIEAFPMRLREAVRDLNDSQLDTPYRPGGWTVRQVVHHCSDSHMNALIRFKLALTEDKPTIRPYYEERWAELADSKTMAIEPALTLLDGLHARWTCLLRSLTQEDLARKFVHPQHGEEFALDETIGQYAWHCNHHLAHVTELAKREGWNG
jgi:hypothetical protein